MRRNAPEAVAKRLGLTQGEIEELLERIPFGEKTGEITPEAWQRPYARQLVEQYAARKRVVARLAERGLL